MCRPVPSRWTIVFWASPERDGRRCPCTRAGLPSFIRHFTSPCPAPAPKVSSRPPLCLPLSPLFISRVLSNVSATFVTFFFFYGTQSPKSSLSVGLFCLPLSRGQAQGPGPDRRRMPTAFFLFLIFLRDTQRGPQSRRSRRDDRRTNRRPPHAGAGTQPFRPPKREGGGGGENTGLRQWA